MARLFHAPAFRIALRRPISTPVARDEVARRTAPSVSIAQLWHESLQTFSAHSVAMLACILSGLMSPFLVGHWIATQAVLQNMDWVGPVPALQEKLSWQTLVALACAGWLTTTLVRGMIASLALQGNAGKAIREALAHLPALLIGSLAYSAIMAACLLGISPIAQNSSTFGQAVDLPIFSTRSRWEKTMSITGQQISSEALALFLPDAGAPFALLLPAAQETLATHPAPASMYDQWLIENKDMPQPQSLLKAFAASQPTTQHLIVATSLVLLIFLETLLRFRMVMAFEPVERITASNKKQGGYALHRFAALASLIASVRFGWKHFGVITLHVWVLRIAGGALVLLLVKLPMAAALHIAMPAALELIGKTPLLPVWQFAQLSIAAFVAAGVLAFSTVYDARLLMALRESKG